MSRSKIAATARQANLLIFASLPEDIRVAASLRFLTRLAFSQESATLLGVQALYAMAQAGIIGSVFETPMAEVTEMVKKRSPKLTKLGTAFGKALLNKGLKKYKDDITNLNGETLESVVALGVVEQLLKNNPLKSGMSVPQVVVFLQNAVWMQASTEARSPEFQLDRYKGVEEKTQNLDEFMSNPRNWDRLPGMDLQKILTKIKDDPKMQDAEGTPRVFQYLIGMSKGFSDKAIAQSMGLNREALKAWLHAPARWGALQKHLRPLLGA